MASNSVDVVGILSPEDKAEEIARLWDKWKRDRIGWTEKVLELRNFLYATDTSTTSVGANPFKNSTHIPKIAQIHQNLKANYMSHMFGSDNFVNWEAHNFEASLVEKARVIESYIKTKVSQSNMVNEFDMMIDDWIQTGVCVGRLNFHNEFIQDAAGVRHTTYVGPRLERLSPHDVMFNVAATSWERSPKIVRSLLSLGELARMAEEEPNSMWSKDVIDKMRERRSIMRAAASEIGVSDAEKARGYLADGFSSITEYYNQDLVEIYEFYGDWYDVDTGEFSKNTRIVVADRCQIVHEGPVESWNGSSYLYFSAWRNRPDNLMGMGPLDNLVGMQYKIDKLENLRADVFDQIANPDIVEQGVIESYGMNGAPGKRWVVDEGGMVSYLRPDATVLQADLQIQNTLILMEELAGAPREAMGIRSPGEKTKFEVQVLDNASNRLFRNKVRKFETEVVERVLNDCLEMAKRNLDGADVIRAQDHIFGAAEFMSITRDDITATGKLRAKGSLYAEKQANAIQNLNMVFNSPVGQMIGQHISKTKLARVVEDLISAEPYALVSDNIGVMEDLQTQRLMQAGAEALQEESMTNGSMESDNEEGVPPI